MATHADLDDPGLFSWVLAVGLWAEFIVAVVAALRSPGGGVQPQLNLQLQPWVQPWVQPWAFALYASLLAAAAVARSGPLIWMRPITWVALAAVAIMHLVGWALALGRRPPGALELLVYGVTLAIIAVLTYRERPLPRAQLLPGLGGWARILEVIARSVGLGFLAGVLLVFVDALVRLPFSGH